MDAASVLKLAYVFAVVFYLGWILARHGIFRHLRHVLRHGWDCYVSMFEPPAHFSEEEKAEWLKYHLLHIPH